MALPSAKKRQPERHSKKSTSGRVENARIHEAAIALLVHLGTWAGAKQILRCALGLVDRAERRKHRKP
jgi:hypothetical protein